MKYILMFIKYFFIFIIIEIFVLFDNKVDSIG